LLRDRSTIKHVLLRDTYHMRGDELECHLWWGGDFLASGRGPTRVAARGRASVEVLQQLETATEYLLSEEYDQLKAFAFLQLA
jgi:hypothetical protein